MKIKSHLNTEERLEFDMTPMIDCCFQLIIFFMLTLRYAAAEGDFNIKMPLGSAAAAPSLEALPTIHVRLTAANDGRISGIRINERPVPDFRQLRRVISDFVGLGRTPDSKDAGGEVELDCDYNLRYEYAIAAITAVSGYVNPEGQIVKLVEKVNFAPPRKP
jgi:biopolymer transport protein ExbD